MGASLARKHADDLELTCARVEGVDLSSADVPRAALRDCVFERGDLANLTTRGSALTRVRFAGTRMTGAQLIDCVLTDVTFRESKIDLAAFRFSKFRRVEFIDCRLTRADFTGADIRGARFVDCDLSGAQFSAVKADGAAFDNCWLDGVGGVADLRGASVRSNDLVSLSRVLARALGIDIVE